LPNGDDVSIVIGLVNSMPDTALRSTERQFCTLLSIASRDLPVRLRLFHLPEVPGVGSGCSVVNHYYEDIDELWPSYVDGLIVTGTEPRAAALVDEPCWPSLTKLVDWAGRHTASTIWSCLAAHAAVFHTDGITRRALDKKLSGIFDCTAVQNHGLMIGAPSHWCVPHSRYNGLPEEALVRHGYHLLSRSSEVGADIFIKQERSLFVLFQGHPEYDAGVLLREYRRDIRRFLQGERHDYPEMPQNYFDKHTIQLLEEFREQAVRQPNLELLPSFPAVPERKLGYSWGNFAVQIYTNWLAYLVGRKIQIHAREIVQDNIQMSTRHRRPSVGNVYDDY
jgi:homoserine O-succinyltransferase